mgnify:CR=1 FL=1
MEAFQANEDAFVAVFTATIADAAGVSTGSVKDLGVMATQSSRDTKSGDIPISSAQLAVDSTTPNLRASAAKATTAASITLRYTIEVPVSSGMTYNQLSSVLAGSVQSNQFSTLLQQHAAQQSVPELSSATSSRVDTEDTTPVDTSNNNNAKSSVLTVPAIVGIVIGGCAVLAVIIFLIARFCSRRAPVGGLPQLDTVHAQGKSKFTGLYMCVL